MHMVMVMIAGRSDLARLIGTNLRIILGVVVTMIVAVMSEMCSVARRMFQRAANTRRCHIRGIQREHDRKKKRETGTHEEVT